MLRKLRSLAAIAAVMAIAGVGVPAHAQSDTLRIGIIGTGNIGGALARHRAAAGHQLVISSRNPEELEALASRSRSEVRVPPSCGQRLPTCSAMRRERLNIKCK